MKDREAWCVAAHGIAKSRARLSDWTITKLLAKTQTTILVPQGKQLILIMNCFDFVWKNHLPLPSPSRPSQSRWGGFVKDGIFQVHIQRMIILQQEIRDWGSTFPGSCMMQLPAFRAAQGKQDAKTTLGEKKQTNRVDTSSKASENILHRNKLSLY